jgi:transposase-like protein
MKPSNANVLLQTEMENWPPCDSIKMEVKTMSKKRKYYAPEEKISILRKHLIEKIPVSELCDQHNLQPTVFYRWQQKFFEQGTVVFERGKDRETAALKRKVVKLEEKIATKNEVLGELMEDHIELKKSLGES